MMKKFLLLPVLILFVSLASAVVFDNTQYYRFDEGSGTVASNAVSGGKFFMNISNWTTTNPKLGAAAFQGDAFRNYAINETAQLGLGANFSVSFWFNASALNTLSYGLVGTQTQSDIGWLVEASGTANKLNAFAKNATQSITITTQDTINTGIYNHGVLLYNGTGFQLWINGTQQANGTLFHTVSPLANFTVGVHPYLRTAGRFWNGTIDEVGIWNRTLSPTDIADLYNNGVGLAFPPSSSLGRPILNSPSNGSLQGNTTLFFNATSTPVGLNNTNMTLFLYNSSGLFNQTTNIMNVHSNQSIFNITGLRLGTYTWSVQSCARNATLHACNVSASNFTFSYGFNKISEQFNTVTTSLSTETFYLNISVISGLSSVGAILVYNNTNFSATSTNNGLNYSFSRQIAIPEVNTLTVKDFYWIVQLIDSVGTQFDFLDDTNQQSINSLMVDNCTVNTQLILNYSLRDEDAQTFLTPSASLNTSMEVEVNIINILDPTQVFTFNMSYQNINPARVCIASNAINSSQTYRLDALNKYSSTSRVVEYHNIQNFTLSNATIPQNINLYDLLITSSQEFLITYKDGNFIPVPDVLIDITRNYPAEGVFKSVEIPKTDADGRAIGHFSLDDIYTFNVRKNGVLLAVFSNVQPFCNNIATGDCKINLQAASTSPRPSNFQTLNSISYTQNYNITSRTYTFTFISLDGTDKAVRLNVTAFTSTLNASICSTLVTAASGTINCIIPASAGNGTAIAQIYVGGILFLQDTFTIQASLADVFGYGRFFLAFLLITTLPLLAISSPAMTVVVFIVGIVIAGMLTFIDLGGVVGASAVFGWIIIAAGVILWKISAGRSG